jgi:hypothetical protein
MDFLATLSLPRIVFSIIPDLFAASLGEKFRRDKEMTQVSLSLVFSQQTISFNRN